MSSTKFQVPFFVVILSLCSTLCQGAVITWTSGAFDSDSDVNNSGTLVEASYFNGGISSNALSGTSQLSGTINVNGVNFEQATFGGVYPLINLTGLTYDIGEYGHTAATTGFGAIIAGLAYDSRVDPQNGMLTGLTVGQDYLVQFYYYHRTENRNVTLADGTGNTITLSDTSNNGVGVFATGTFTADGSQQLVFDANTGSQFLNGYQLREAPVPEPATLLTFAGLASCFGLGLFRRRSKQRNAFCAN